MYDSGSDNEPEIFNFKILNTRRVYDTEWGQYIKKKQNTSKLCAKRTILENGLNIIVNIINLNKKVKIVITKL